MLSNEKHVDRYAFSVAEAARAMGIGQTLARYLVKTKAIESVRIGKRVVITPQAIAAFLAKGGAQ